jgi:DNA-binding CsgD family transcriptional regulator
VLGDPRFDRALFEFVSDRTAASILFAIEMGNHASGRVLVTEARDRDLTRKARHVSQVYAEQDYATDEVLTRQSGMPPGEARLVIQHPEDRDAEFRARYFDDMAIAEELSIFERGQDSTLYLGFCCKTASFGPDKLAEVQAIAPLLGSLVRRHAALMGERDVPPADVRERRFASLRQAFLAHDAGLTEREAEVCAAIAVGYRAESAAARLGISPNTVATHRKRAYAKLGISSQTELFAIFFGLSV